MIDPQNPSASHADLNRTQLAAPPVLDPNKTVMGAAPTLNATITIKPVQCPVCKTFNPAGMMFCVECGLIFDRALPDDAFGAPAIKLPCLVDGSGREHPLRPGTNLIGREGDIALPDPRVSRRHAVISSDAGAMSIEDSGSTNGTLLNGDKLEPGETKPLQEGDKLSFGGVDLILSLPGQAEATQAVPSNRTASIEPPRIEPPAAHLVGEDLHIALKRGGNTFGRKPENDAPIPDPYVSGRHGLIEIADDGIFVTDLGSTNGTMVNDAKINPNTRTKITSDDEIRLGGLVLRVELS